MINKNSKPASDPKPASKPEIIAPEPPEYQQLGERGGRK